MPNKRMAGKKLIASWVNEETKEVLEKMAKAKGVNVSDIIKQIIEKGVKNGERIPGKEQAQG